LSHKENQYKYLFGMFLAFWGTVEKYLQKYIYLFSILIKSTYLIVSAFLNKKIIKKTIIFLN